MLEDEGERTAAEQARARPRGGASESAVVHRQQLSFCCLSAALSLLLALLLAPFHHRTLPALPVVRRSARDGAAVLIWLL